jgi:hypothetical protein
MTPTRQAVKPEQGDHKGQYISIKKVCESNKAASQAQIKGFYHIRA